MKNSLKRIVALALAVVLAVLVLPANVVKADFDDNEWTIVFTDDEESFRREVTGNGSLNNDQEIGSEIPYAYLGRNSDLAKLAKAHGQIEGYANGFYGNVWFDFTGDYPDIMILEDSRQFFGISCLLSGVNPANVQSIEYYVTIVDTRNPSVDNDWVILKSETMDPITLEPNKPFNLKKQFPLTNPKTQLYILEVSILGKNGMDGYVIYDPFIFKSQLNNHELHLRTENTLYRMYDDSRGEHFYTAKIGERNSLIKSGWIDETREANSFKGSPVKTNVYNTPVYRLYNENNGGTHMYTTKKSEYNNLVNSGWSGEGVQFYVSMDKSGNPIYRTRNPESKAGEHQWSNRPEFNDLTKTHKWADEGISWYSPKN